MQARQLAADLVTIVKQLIELNVKMRKIKVSRIIKAGTGMLLFTCSHDPMSGKASARCTDTWAGHGLACTPCCE